MKEPEYDEWNPPPVEKKSKLKMSNEASLFNKKSVEKAQAKQWFEKEAELNFSTVEARKEATALVVSSFWNLFKGKELKENKGPNRLSMEQAVFKNLIDYGIAANQDEELEGQGSIYLITLLFKAMLEQKEAILQLEHRVEELQSAQKINKQ